MSRHFMVKKLFKSIKKKFFEFRLQLASAKLISPEKEINLSSEKIKQN